MPARPDEPRLLPHEIVGPRGARGMGEVIRARDPRLGREVALKLLPASVAGDPERHARFEREARALARIDHPNNLTVHALEREGERVFVVTELPEGCDLRELPGRERLSRRRAAEIAAAVANGLGGAHAADVAYRDLKPENLFVIGDGRVKVLDFGLARRAMAPTMGSNSHAETRTSPPQPTPGTVLGTIGYMAPEQVRGEPSTPAAISSSSAPRSPRCSPAGPPTTLGSTCTIMRVRPDGSIASRPPPAGEGSGAS